MGESLVENKKKSGLKTVSYTHLDVYKRQHGERERRKQRTAIHERAVLSAQHGAVPLAGQLQREPV